MPLQDPSFSVNLMPNWLYGVLGWMKNLATQPLSVPSLGDIAT